MIGLGMIRPGRFVFAAALLALLSVCPLVGQTNPPSVSRPGTTPTTPRPATTPTRPGTRKPCWEQVGVSKSAIEQRRQIAESTRSQVESVCNDSSLTPQQKQQQIRQIREQAHAQMNALVSPQQEQELRSCRAQRGEAISAPHHGLGPCGEMASGLTPRPGITPARKSQVQAEEPTQP